VRSYVDPLFGFIQQAGSRVGYMYVHVSGFQNHKANVQYVSVV